MEITGQQLIALPQEATWKALNDPGVLKDCIPGCEAIEQISPEEYQMTMVAKVGPVNARFRGKMTLSNISPPVTYTLRFEGQGGVAGFARGEARVELAPEGNSTQLKYAAKAMVGGKLAQVGARLIDGVARKMADEFFTAFNRRVSGEPAR
jgi:carbon monoxide dehydrogenase subunit G